MYFYDFKVHIMIINGCLLVEELLIFHILIIIVPIYNVLILSSIFLTVFFF